jgi:hypothetical protein
MFSLGGSQGKTTGEHRGIHPLDHGFLVVILVMLRPALTVNRSMWVNS